MNIPTPVSALVVADNGDAIHVPRVIPHVHQINASVRVQFRPHINHNIRNIKRAIQRDVGRLNRGQINPMDNRVTVFVRNLNRPFACTVSGLGSRGVAKIPEPVPKSRIFVPERAGSIGASTFL
jgi:hypothetical protein